MPVSADPNATFETWLASDASKPADVRPVFVFRFLTYGAQCRRAKLFEADAKTVDLGDQLFAAIRGQLAGTRNVGEPLEDVLTWAEAWELLGLATHNIAPGELLGFASPSPANTAGLATAQAATVPAVATVPPAADAVSGQPPASP